MNRVFFLIVAVLVFVAAKAEAVDGDGAQYLGGTMPLIEKAEGKLITNSETVIEFTPKKKNQAPLEIPYSAITEREYGQKAGRRVAVAVMISPLAKTKKPESTQAWLRNRP